MKDRVLNQDQQSQSDIHPSKGWLQRRAVRSLPSNENEVKPPITRESGLNQSFVHVPVHDNRLPAVQRSPFPQQLSQHPATETPSVSLGERVLQKKNEMTVNSQAPSEVSRPNQTGLPDRLKTGIENLSGYSMDNVRVHYNSDRPAPLQAHAYTQGTNIHIAPGQEKHLPHEAWHVVQQMQGRVKPTMQAKGVAINDDHALEREADRMGVKATSGKRPDSFSSNETQGSDIRSLESEATRIRAYIGEWALRGAGGDTLSLGKETKEETRWTSGTVGQWARDEYLSNNRQSSGASQVVQRYPGLDTNTASQFNTDEFGVVFYEGASLYMSKSNYSFIVYMPPTADVKNFKDIVAEELDVNQSKLFIVNSPLDKRVLQTPEGKMVKEKEKELAELQKQKFAIELIQNYLKKIDVKIDNFDEKAASAIAAVEETDSLGDTEAEAHPENRKILVNPKKITYGLYVHEFIHWIVEDIKWFGGAGISYRTQIEPVVEYLTQKAMGIDMRLSRQKGRDQPVGEAYGLLMLRTKPFLDQKSMKYPDLEQKLAMSLREFSHANNEYLSQLSTKFLAET